jgi:VIT1/CCC1 family predicted Fe2+/Mn2+ transporter
MSDGRFARFKESFRASFGDVVFGMEDGAVSIFGLVFGLAHAAETSTDVLLAGATGAAAAAVSMAAGVWLDASSERDTDLAATRRYALLARQDSARCEAEIRERLQAAGTPEPGIAAIVAAADGREGGLAGLAVALRDPPEPSAVQGPGAHALWMFLADLFAGAVPVLPFALLPIDDARWLSIGITAILLIVLGIGRGVVAERGIARSVVETVGVAAAAALGGLLIGQAVTRLV